MSFYRVDGLFVDWFGRKHCFIYIVCFFFIFYLPPQPVTEVPSTASVVRIRYKQAIYQIDSLPYSYTLYVHMLLFCKTTYTVSASTKVHYTKYRGVDSSIKSPARSRAAHPAAQPAEAEEEEPLEAEEESPPPPPPPPPSRLVSSS